MNHAARQTSICIAVLMFLVPNANCDALNHEGAEMLLRKTSSVELIDVGKLWDGGSIQLVFLARPLDEQFSVVILNPMRSRKLASQEPPVVFFAREDEKSRGELIKQGGYLESRLIQLLANSQQLQQNQKSVNQKRNLEALLNLLRARDGNWDSISRRFVTFDWSAFERRVDEGFRALDAR